MSATVEQITRSVEHSLQDVSAESLVSYKMTQQSHHLTLSLSLSLSDGSSSRPLPLYQGEFPLCQ